MPNTAEEFQQILVSQSQIIDATPSWSTEAQRDYYRFKLDLVTSSDSLDSLADRVEQNEQDISQNAQDISENFKYLHGDQNKSPDYSETVGYTKYDLVSFDGNEYSAKDDIPSPAGVFDPLEWRLVSTTGNNSYVNEHIDAPDPHPQYQMKMQGLSLFGTVNNFTFNTTPSKLINYSDSETWGTGEVSDLDPANGEITIPEDGLYRVNCVLIGQQGNNTKEESMFLEIDVDGLSGIISVFDVATDKTDYRTFSVSFIRRFAEDEVLSLFCTATANMGTFTVEATTFEIERVE